MKQKQMKTTLKVAAAVSNEWMESSNEPITLTEDF